MASFPNMHTRGLMKQLCRALPLGVLAFVAAHCLPDPLPVEGRLLFAGRGISAPSFVTIGDQPFVLFEQQVSTAPAGALRVSDVYVVPWEGGPARKLVANHSGRWSVSRRDDSAYYMFNERLFNTGTAGDLGVPVATLGRVTLADGVVETIEDVTSYSVEGDLLQYRKVVAGADSAEIHLREKDGTDHVMGSGSGSLTIVEGTRVYMVASKDRAFTRFATLSSPPETLRKNVVGFVLSSDEKRALLATSDGDQSKSVLYDMATGVEKSVPIGTCCWRGFRGNGSSFEYFEFATSSNPARVHLVDLETLKDTVTFTLPDGMSDLGAFFSRPMSGDEFFTDSRHRIARRTAGGDYSLLPLRPWTPTFTADGKYFIYFEPEVLEPEPEGRLMIVDGDFATAPRQLTPPGTRVSQSGFFFIDGPEPLVFWAHYPRGSSDLYFSDYVTGSYRTVAQGISQVTVTRRRLVGILRVSTQDLTGDFVERDPITGDEVVIAHSASDFAIGPIIEKADGSAGPPRAVFILKERVTSEREGLWATTLHDYTMSKSGEAGK